MRFRSTVVALLAVTVVTSAVYLRRRPVPRVDVIETEGAVAPAPLEPSPLPSPSRIAAPALSEVQPTLDRVFGQAVVMDSAIRSPFVAKPAWQAQSSACLMSPCMSVAGAPRSGVTPQYKHICRRVSSLKLTPTVGT